VGVAEHAQGGFLVEQDCFAALEEYLAKTHVFKRDYNTVDADTIDTNVDVENPYSGMQTAIIEMLDNAGRLCRWTTDDDLGECAAALL
jgi:hypothetical protein